MIIYFVRRNFRGTCSSVETLKGYMLIFQNALRDTCLSVGMLKGYMVRERLGTPELDEQNAS